VTQRRRKATRTGCINLALKGHGFSRAVKAAKTLGFSP
jgi:hypothetical protein